MTERIYVQSSNDQMQREIALRCIEAFRTRFGPAHFYLAQHAAFPLALTPDLLYHLWANFQRDEHGRKFTIPWIAVADLLLSNICNEVGDELFEMSTIVRELLVQELKRTFGDQRIKELSNFLLAYVNQRVKDSDPDLVKTQRWVALAYTQPDEAAREIAFALRESVQSGDRAEQVRMSSLVETFVEPLAGFAPLLMYAKGVGFLAHGNIVEADHQLRNMGTSIMVEGVTLPIPNYKRAPEKQNDEQVHPNSRLRYERERRGWSQQELAKRIGTIALSVFRWERGINNPNAYYRLKLSQVFEKTAEELGLVAQPKIGAEKLGFVTQTNIDINTPSFAQLLRQERLYRCWSQQELADKVGTTPTNIGRWERGVTRPAPYFQQKLCELFGKTLEELGLIALLNTDSNALSFGQLLRRERERRAWSQQELADKVDTTPNTVGLWERDKAKPSVHFQEKLKLILGELGKMVVSVGPPDTLWNVPYRRNPFFTGREDLLIAIHASFIYETPNAVSLLHPIALSCKLRLSTLRNSGLKTGIRLIPFHCWPSQPARVWLSA